jgi:hypothetical protein
MAINKSMTQNRDLGIVALTMKNAFGSASIKFWTHNLTNMYFPQIIWNVVIDSYYEAAGNILRKFWMKNPIKIKRTVTQSCSLHLLLFNCCLDPLVRTLNSRDQNIRFPYQFQLKWYLHLSETPQYILIFTYNMDNLITLIDHTFDYQTLAWSCLHAT